MSIEIKASDVLTRFPATIMVLVYTKDGYVVTSKKSNNVGWNLLQDSTYGVVTSMATAEAICYYLNIRPEGVRLEEIYSYANVSYTESNEPRGKIVKVYKLDTVVSILDLPVTLRDGLQISAMPLHALKDKQYSSDVELYTKIIDELEKDQIENV